MNKKEKEMRLEAREAIIETLKNGYNGYYCDLHHEVFNTDNIGTYQAKKALKEYGVFEAIEKVQTYENDNYGKIYTDLSDPKKLIDMLYYIIGEEVLFEMMDGVEVWDENLNNQADEDTNAAILKAIEEKGTVKIQDVSGEEHEVYVISRLQRKKPRRRTKNIYNIYILTQSDKEYKHDRRKE